MDETYAERTLNHKQVGRQLMRGAAVVYLFIVFIFFLKVRLPDPTAIMFLGMTVFWALQSAMVVNESPLEKPMDRNDRAIPAALCAMVLGMNLAICESWLIYDWVGETFWIIPAFYCTGLIGLVVGVYFYYYVFARLDRYTYMVVVMGMTVGIPVYLLLCVNNPLNLLEFLTLTWWKTDP
ncbi:MAG: hypothetical protein AAF570_17020, partial [Bacteroidota bacterium]